MPSFLLYGCLSRKQKKFHSYKQHSTSQRLTHAGSYTQLNMHTSTHVHIFYMRIFLSGHERTLFTKTSLYFIAFSNIYAFNILVAKCESQESHTRANRYTHKYSHTHKKYRNSMLYMNSHVP